MTIHTHSGGGLLFPFERLPFEFQAGDTFAYSSRLCSGSAPFNDVGLNFVPDYPGVDDDGDGTAPVRHHIQGTITSLVGNRGTMEGTITTVLCVPGDSPNGQVESDHVIVSHFRAFFTVVSNDEIQITGVFRLSPTENTGTFEDIVGGGLMQGRITCLGQATCEQLGVYTDFVASRGDPTLPAGQLQPGVVGSYYDPTVTPVT
jgi:hypothetical protein